MSKKILITLSFALLCLLQVVEGRLIQQIPSGLPVKRTERALPDLVVEEVFLDDQQYIVFKLRNSGGPIPDDQFQRSIVRIYFGAESNDFTFADLKGLSAFRGEPVDPRGILKEPNGFITFKTRIKLSMPSKVSVIVDYNNQIQEQNEKNNRMDRELKPKEPLPQVPSSKLPMDRRRSSVISSLGCTYSISPPSMAFDYNSHSENVTVTAPSGCDWTAASNIDWIKIISGNSGSGSGTVNYSIEANLSTKDRTGTLTIAGKTFRVDQRGAVCGESSTSLSHLSQYVDASGGTDIISVIAPIDCDWTAESTVAWIKIISGGSGRGNGTITYSVEPNPDTNPRSGKFLIAYHSFMVTQEGKPPSAPTGPDIAIEKVEVSNDIQILFTITVKNIGNADINTNYLIQIFWQHASGNWLEVESTVGNPLKAGESQTIKHMWNDIKRICQFIEQKIIVIGENQTSVLVDPLNSIKNEKHKDNNQYASKFFWNAPLADLKIEDFQLDYRDFWGVTKFGLILKLKNIGDAPPVVMVDEIRYPEYFIRVSCKKEDGSHSFHFSPFIQKSTVNILNIKDFLVVPGEVKTFTYPYYIIPQNYGAVLPVKESEGNLECTLEFDQDHILLDKNRQNNIFTKSISIPKRNISISNFSPNFEVIGIPNVPPSLYVFVKTPYDLLEKDSSLTLLWNNEKLKIESVQVYSKESSGDTIYLAKAYPPQNEGEGPIMVSAYGVEGKSIDAFRIYGLPEITGISPSSAKRGDTITIYGKNFIEHGKLNSYQGITGVAFSPEEGYWRYQFINENEIKVEVPFYAESGEVTVRIGWKQVKFPFAVLKQSEQYYR